MTEWQPNYIVREPTCKLSEANNFATCIHYTDSSVHNLTQTISNGTNNSEQDLHVILVLNLINV